MSYLDTVLRTSARIWVMRPRGGGWVVGEIVKDADLDGSEQFEPCTRILRRKTAERRLAEYRITDAMRCLGWEQEEAKQIAHWECRRNSRLRIPEWRTVVRKYFHWSYYRGGGVFSMSAAQHNEPVLDFVQKSNVIMFPTPPSAVARKA